MRSIFPLAFGIDIQRTGDSERTTVSHAESARADFEVVALTLNLRPEDACVAVQRAGFNFILATGVIRVGEASALKEIETLKMSACVRCFPAFYSVEGCGASGRTDENAVCRIWFQRRTIAVGTAI